MTVVHKLWDDEEIPIGKRLDWDDRFIHDPKQLAFIAVRYRFAAKMLDRCWSIIDVGCGAGMGTAFFLDTRATTIHGVDFDPDLINQATDNLLEMMKRSRPHDLDRISFSCGDFVDGEIYPTNAYDGLCCIDIEHIGIGKITPFLRRVKKMLTEHGIAVIGAGNIDSDDLRDELENHFRRVFLFDATDIGGVGDCSLALAIK